MANKNQEYTEQYADYAMEQMRRFPMGNYVVKVLRILKVFR